MTSNISTIGSMKGEVAGSFLLGLLQSFHNLNMLPQGGLNLGSEIIDPDKWYPYSTLIDALDLIEKQLPSKTILFQAGMHFLRIWYEHGPGKDLIHSSLDWLYANQSSGGYNTVVRGGTPDEIGWCILTEIDIERGIAIYENVNPIKGDYLRGIFYGGCVIFDDMDFIDVTSKSEIYLPNPSYSRTILTVLFKQKDKALNNTLNEKLKNWDVNPVHLNPEEINSLVWQFKGLKIQNQIEKNYNAEITPILAEAILTSQKNEEALLVAKQVAEKANNAKSQFLATMSHEIRTPLNGILGMAQLLLSGNIGEEERNEFTKIIYDSGVTLLTLLNDILDLSKIEARKIELEQIEIEPLQIAKDSAILFNEIANAKGLVVQLERSSLRNSSYISDPIRIRQMITNLISNAIKFTREGSVKIGVLEIENDGTEALLEFFVEDTGIGIPAEKIDRLFKPFSQADASTTREYGGTGLGLSIVQKIAQLMGGEVGVQSKLGKGSRFHFRVKARCSNKSSKEMQSKINSVKESSYNTSTISGKLIWVAEDNRLNQLLIKKFLEKFGLRYEIFDNGLDLYNMIQNGMRPDLILMDCQMPVMDGYEASTKIRQWLKENNAHPLPILACTANSFEEDWTLCENAGMNGMIQKPIQLNELHKALLNHLTTTPP